MDPVWRSLLSSERSLVDCWRKTTTTNTSFRLNQASARTPLARNFASRQVGLLFIPWEYDIFLVYRIRGFSLTVLCILHSLPPSWSHYVDYLDIRFLHTGYSLQNRRILSEKFCQHNLAALILRECSASCGHKELLWSLSLRWSDMHSILFPSYFIILNLYSST